MAVQHFPVKESRHLSHTEVPTQSVLQSLLSQTVACFPQPPCWPRSFEASSFEVSTWKNKGLCCHLVPQQKMLEYYGQVDGIRSRTEEECSCRLLSLQGLGCNCISIAELQQSAGSAGDAAAQLCAGAAGNETQKSWMQSFRS